MTRPAVRFAPSPNGALHLGHALSALLAFQTARRLGGRFLLRIEDIDQTRCRPEHEAAILADLAWLGISFETPVRRQSEHFADYAVALERLAALGLVYSCHASRQEIQRAATTLAERSGIAGGRDPDGALLYPGRGMVLDGAEEARRAAAGLPHAVRLDMAQAMALAGPLHWLELGMGPTGPGGEIPAHPGLWGDVILARKETPTSYHLSVVVDDALQGVTHVVRGHDLVQATSVHRLLQRLLGLAAPVYLHHRLVPGPDGRKLSKSAGDTALASLRAAGATPADIRRMVGL
ncbi:MAG: tRNA glutamyl-Q(34) synthetase GluQRS [Hyphomicrobiales bacterium]